MLLISIVPLLAALSGASGLPFLLPCSGSGLSLFFLVNSIANQVDDHVRRRMLFDFHEPLLNVRESLFAGDIVAEEDAVGASVENSGD